MHYSFRSDEPGWEIDHFETTPLMSTFSVAAIICDLGFVTPLHPALDGGELFCFFPSNISTGYK